VGQLLHLTTNLGAQRATAAFQRFELAGVRRDFAFQLVRLGRQIPRLLHRVDDVGGRIAGRIGARNHAREERRAAGPLDDAR